MESSAVQPVLLSPDSHPSQQLTSRQRWIDLGLILLIAIVPFIVNASYALVHPVRQNAAAINFHFVTNMLQEFSSMLLLVYILKRQGRGLVSVGLNLRWRDVPVSALLAFIGLVTSAIFSIFIRKFSLALTGVAADMRNPHIIFGGAAPLLLAAYGVTSSVFEETIVRGFLMTELWGLSCPVWLAAVTSIIVQTSYHLYYGFAGALSISGIFLVFALFFARQRRLAPVILAHMYIDLLASLAARH
jgi:membrane protease YdiL (CAAX protease family)